MFCLHIFLSFYKTHQVRCYHFFIVEIIVESVNLIQMSKWKVIFSHHDGEKLGFTKKYRSKLRANVRLFL